MKWKLIIIPMLSVIVILALIGDVVLFSDPPIEYSESQILYQWPNGDQNASGAFVTEWFNGLGWVSIFGCDDCNNVTDAMTHYQEAGLYEVPTTAYLYGNSGDPAVLIDSDSELALHYPHDWSTSGTVTYSQALTLAKEGKDFLDHLSLASKWSDGQHFISMANPGDEAALPLLSAEWEIVGIRSDGYASNIDGLISGSDHPFDLMNLDREINTDHQYSMGYLMNITNNITHSDGILIIYGHQWAKINDVQFLQWLANDSDSWMATQGEMSSYIYGQHSLNLTGSNGTYIVSKPDPTKDGYWNVPITICIPNCNVTNITVNGRVVSPLINDRELGMGYCQRDGDLYVTEFWNGTNVLVIK